MYTIQFIRLAYYTIKLIYKRWSWDVNVCTHSVLCSYLMYDGEVLQMYGNTRQLSDLRY